MRAVLTTNSKVPCLHEGSVATSGMSRLRIDGGRALSEDGVAGRVVSGCKTPTDDKNAPCTTATSVTAGAATRLAVDGAPVLAATLAGQSNGKVAGTTPQLLGKALAKQSRLLTD